MAYAARHAERWRRGARIDLDRELAALTMSIAGKVLFDADVEGEASEVGEALTTVPGRG